MFHIIPLNGRFMKHMKYNPPPKKIKGKVQVHNSTQRVLEYINVIL